MTDVAKFPNDILAILGTIILVCRFFDGVSDIVMGLLIEKTHSKLGKARFWYGVSIIPMTITFVLIFVFSGLDSMSFLVLVSVLYFLFAVVFYTMNSVSFNAELPRISDDPYDQSNMCTVNSVFTSVGSLAVALTVPILNAFGGLDKQSSWIYLVSILAFIAIIGETISFFKIKEKKEIEPVEVRAKGDLKKGLKALLSTKYFYIAVLMFCLNYYLSLSVSTIGTKYAAYVLGNSNYSALFGSLPMIMMGVGLLATPFLVKKIGKRWTLTLAIMCVSIGNGVGSIWPYSLGAGLTGAMIKGLGSAIVMSQLYTLAPDIVRYLKLKTGLRLEGLAASANSFGSKIGSGLGSAVVLWTLAYCGYKSELAAGESQPQSAITSFIAIYWWVPLALSLVLLLLSLTWDINKKSEALEAKETDKAQAEK